MADRKYAVLIDADNIGSQYIKVIMDEVSKKGIVTIKRIYGDWCNNVISPWKEVNLEYSILPVQQYSYTKGKNATDSAMIIDAMDLLYTADIDGFCLVSSDSDFTRLAARLREAGKDVVGMGKKQTPQPFIKACTDFKYVDVLIEDQEEGSKKKQKAVKTEPNKDQEINSQTDVDSIKAATIQIIEENSDDTGWIGASEIGAALKKRFSDFDPRNYGYKKLVPLLESFGLEIEKREDPNNIANPMGQLVYVKVKKKVGNTKASGKKNNK